MIYMDNAATGGHKPSCVISAVNAAMQLCANAGRSGHKLSLACAERVYTVRKLLCEFFNGYSSDRVVFTKNCTEALNVAIFGCLREGDKVVSTVAEHNSVLRPLNYLEKRGVKVLLAPLTANGEIDLYALSQMSTGAKAVIITLASNVTGVAPQIKKVRSQIPPQTLLICDGAQACGHVPVDMMDCGIDALAVAGHKGMLGLQGSGALIFSQRFNPSPVLFGGTGSESYNLDMPEFYPDKLESGTLCYPAIISLGEGALYLQTRLYEHKDVTEYLAAKVYEGLQNINGVTLYSLPNPYGIIAFSLRDIQSESVASTLSEDYSICVRGGLHCAPLMHEALHSNGLVRVSLSPFNTEREVESFLRAVEKLAQK